MTVPEAAKLLGMTPFNIHGWILNGDCPFGYCIKKKTRKGGKNTYFVVDQQLYRFLEGKKDDVSVY